MLNKRAATLLAFVLAGSMALSTPATAMAASGGSEKASQTEDEESDMDDETQEDEEEEKTSQAKEDEDSDSVKGKKADTKEDSGEEDGKKTKGSKASSTASKSASSSSNKTSAKILQDQPRAGDSESANTPTPGGSTSGSETPTPGGNTSGNETPTPGGNTSGNETPTPGGNVSGNVISAGDFKLSGDLSEGEDYSYDEKQHKLTIKTSKAVKISGIVSNGNISVESSTTGADLTLANLQMGVNSGENNIRVASDTKVQIHLFGENTLNTLLPSDDKSVTIDGPGLLRIARINKTVIIKGGNIQGETSPSEPSWGGKPQNENGIEVYAASVQKLNTNAEYDIKILTAGTPSAKYAYGDQIRSDSNGTIVMYLPAGEASLTLDNTVYQGTVTSSGGKLTAIGTLTPTGTPIPSGSITPSPSPSPTTPVSDMQADPANNGLYWINSGSTYRSGATLQFYATGDGYGPEDPQDINPDRGATRYKPVSWTVAPDTSGSGTSDKGSWTKRSEVTTGQTVSGAYTSGEYRYKASFTPSTSQTTSVAYTLQVRYDRETYYGKNRKWEKDGTTATKSVSFYIRNTSLTVTPTYTPRPTYYTTTTPVRSTITTTAAQSSVSSNARNASTGDHTPIGTLVFLMIAAAGSGIGIFRKKRDSF